MVSFRWADDLGKNDIAQGQADGKKPNQKVNKAEEPVYLFVNIVLVVFQIFR